jgi:hypothetical protein
MDGVVSGRFFGMTQRVFVFLFLVHNDSSSSKDNKTLPEKTGLFNLEAGLYEKRA